MTEFVYFHVSDFNGFTSTRATQPVVTDRPYMKTSRKSLVYYSCTSYEITTKVIVTIDKDKDFVVFVTTCLMIIYITVCPRFFLLD